MCSVSGSIDGVGYHVFLVQEQEALVQQLINFLAIYGALMLLINTANLIKLWWKS